MVPNWKEIATQLAAALENPDELAKHNAITLYEAARANEPPYHSPPGPVRIVAADTPALPLSWRISHWPAPELASPRDPAGANQDTIRLDSMHRDGKTTLLALFPPAAAADVADALYAAAHDPPPWREQTDEPDTQHEAD